MRQVWIGCFAGLMMTLTACGDDDGDDDGGSTVTIASEPLTGRVGGQSWTVALAETDAFLSEGEPDFWVELYRTSGATCQTGIKEGHHLILNVPRQPGDYRLSLARNATFVLEEDGTTTDNLIATEGRLVVDEVTADTIRGGAYIRYDAQNSVNGSFTATICP